MISSRTTHHSLPGTDLKQVPWASQNSLKGDVESFCDDLVKKAGVLLLPGSVYDDAHNHFRLGLGRKNLPQAVDRLETYLSKASF